MKKMNNQTKIIKTAIETAKISLTLNHGKFKLFFKKPASFAVKLGFES